MIARHLVWYMFPARPFRDGLPLESIRLIIIIAAELLFASYTQTSLQTVICSNCKLQFAFVVAGTNLRTLD